MKHILTEKQFRRLIDKSVEKVLNRLLNEGIDFDPETKTVSYNPSHEDNVDTSLENNPTSDGEIVPGVQVWSIFKRKRGLRGDGNPLVYALKGEGWTFRSEKDREAIEKQFDAIATKFASIYKIGVTVLMPSGNELNNHIAEIVLSKSTNGELIEGAICKLTTQEVDEIVLDFKSKFREYYKKDFNAAYYRLGTFLDEMDKERKGTFGDRGADKVKGIRTDLSDRYAAFGEILCPSWGGEAGYF